MRGPIVVGVSPTTGSPNALRWAAEEAELRGAPLMAVLAWRPPRAPAAPAGRPSTTALSGATADHAKIAEEALHGFVTVALGRVGKTRCRAVKGTAVTALLEAASDAQLLVVGEPRAGRLASVRASLVAPQVVVKASCPVVAMPGAAVVRSRNQPHGTD
ncbi:MAG: universal stress protein [Jatrophihabitantaceae bacterium]